MKKFIDITYPGVDAGGLVAAHQGFTYSKRFYEGEPEYERVIEYQKKFEKERELSWYKKLWKNIVG